MKKLLLLFILAGQFASAQNVSGYWYGTANVENAGGNTYLVEIIASQNSRGVQAILNYYFRNTFRSVKLNGNYNPTTREFNLFNVPVPFVGSRGDMIVDCQMDFKGLHRVAIAGSTLTGRFIGRGSYRYTCPELVFDLRLNKDAGNQDSVLQALQQFKENYQVWTPTATDTLVAAVVQQRTIQNIPMTREYAEREVEVQKELEVTGDSLLIDLYDNGEVDGDSVSIFFNDQLLGANLKLSTRSVQLKLALDSTRAENTITMFANNLGSIPPNTALMLVYDGTKRYEVRLSSSLQKSAALRLRRAKVN